jgi:uncharacterized protein YcnI
MTDKIFADGFIAKRHEKAPDFVTCNLSVKVSEAVPFLQQNAKEGWCNLQVKQAKSGKYYVELDTFRPTQGEAAKAGMEQVMAAIAAPAESFADDDIPF